MRHERKVVERKSPTDAATVPLCPNSWNSSIFSTWGVFVHLHFQKRCKTWPEKCNNKYEI